MTASGVRSERYLRWSIEVLGIERIMFSTHYPYRFTRRGGSRRLLKEANLIQPIGIAHANWEWLVGGIRRCSASRRGELLPLRRALQVYFPSSAQETELWWNLIAPLFASREEKPCHSVRLPMIAGYQISSFSSLTGRFRSR